MRLYATTGDAVAVIDEDDARLDLEGSGAQCIAVDGTDVYCGTFDRGLYHSTDGGNTWREAGAGIEHQRVLSVAVSPADGSLYVGTEPSALYRSADGGDSWEELDALQDIPSRERWSFPPRPWTHHVRWIAPHHIDRDLLFVGIELGGVMITRDGGSTFADHHEQACIDPHVLRTHRGDPDRVYEVAGDGVAASRDRGATFERLTDGMDRTYSWGLAVDPSDPDVWYVSSATGPDRAHGQTGDAGGRLYRRTGDTWEPIRVAGRGDLLGAMPYALLTLEDGTLVVGFDDGAIAVSDDHGDSWRDLGVELPGILQLSA